MENYITYASTHKKFLQTMKPFAAIFLHAVLLLAHADSLHAQSTPSSAPQTPPSSAKPLRSIDSTISATAQQLGAALQAAFTDSTQQNSTEHIETLIGIMKSSGFYGTGSMRFTTLGGRFATMLGGYGGWYFNKSLMVGGGWYAHTAGRLFGVIGTSAATLREDVQVEGFNYGGAVVEYTFDSDKALHYTAQVLMGGGRVAIQTIQNRNTTSAQFPSFDDERSGFFVIEPALQAELNITRAVRIAFGGSYRFIAGLRPSAGVTSADMSGFALLVGIKFGKF